MMAGMSTATFRQVGAERAEEWMAKGHKLRHFFAHRLFHLPKCGPDGYRVAQAMCGLNDLGAHWQLLMYADQALVTRFPRELFFDEDLIWHRQHLGRAGQVATASMVVDSGVLYSMTHHADLVQRIGRFREHKTQIEKRLGGWPWMLLNGILAFAQERGLRTVRVPRSPLAMRHTDTAREVKPYLFERVYDRPALELPGTIRAGEWWEIDVAQAAAAVVTPVPDSQPLTQEKVVCVFHDLERGLGHRAEDSALAQRADRTAGATLQAILALESEAGVRVTYNVVGQILDEVHDELKSAGHAVAFHSFDHSSGDRQLVRCREIDYRLKGYRPPRSLLTSETTDEQLAFHNFEWFASGRHSLGTDAPLIRNRLVRLPVTLDDFPLYTGALTYEDWERTVLKHVERDAYTAIGLHDCYAHLWLDRYAELLDKLSAAATPRTFDQVSAEVVIGAAA
jgi:hypothetical protein